MKSIKRNIDSGVISTIHDYEREIALMFMNAIVYNPIGHEVHERTRVMAIDAWKIIDVSLINSTICSPSMVSDGV